MFARNSYDYIILGIMLRVLSNVDKDTDLKFIKETIKDIEESLNNLEFEVCLAITNSVSYINMKDAIQKKLDSSGTVIGESLSYKIIDQFSGLEKVVFAESSTKKIYSIPSRRFNSDYLLNHPHKLFKDGNFNKLSELAKTDISSACKCILFGESTAAAFHILRATEETLKLYYFHHRKQKRLPKPMWGNMIEQLKLKKSSKPSKTLLDSLDILRKNYRNPTQHPDTIYTIDTAQDLFGVCLDVIGKMSDEL